MAAVLGIWIGLTGVLALLVGLTSMRRLRQLRRRGVRAWAVAERLPGEQHLMALRYTLPDQRALVKVVTGKAAAVLPGERVLIWYDPADPGDVLVHGRQRRVPGLALLVTGALFVAGGAVIGILAP
jgi:hypothetical protein